MEGIVTVLKPPGMTSSNAVYDVRRIFGIKKVGHLGTLDPGAAGVLPVCLGRATHLFEYLVDKEKTYIAEITFGISTDTLDSYGTVTCTEPDADIAEDRLQSVLPQFTGAIRQIAPAYSALKVDGRPMYDLARAGEEVPERVRDAFISELTLVRKIAKNRYLLKVRCSRGTYIRTLCCDIGNALGVPAMMSFLLRTESGPFKLESAFSVAELTERTERGTLEETVISCEQALAAFPALQLREDRRKATMNALETNLPHTEDGIYRVYCGGFLGLGEVHKSAVRLTVHLY
ncbi:MAG: tRNA pseudouridine(55) synthase TruB [Clostridia bacterium]|nr:tRNA pseudouridine(55) synthase TruB [Clostridia bacterium]